MLKTAVTILRKNMLKNYRKKIERCKNIAKTCKMVKMHDFSNLGVHISRFCANLGIICAVAQPHD